MVVADLAYQASENLGKKWKVLRCFERVKHADRCSWATLNSLSPDGGRTNGLPTAAISAPEPVPATCRHRFRGSHHGPNAVHGDREPEAEMGRKISDSIFLPTICLPNPRFMERIHGPPTAVISTPERNGREQD